jgi:hypothetical protein
LSKFFRLYGKNIASLKDFQKTANPSVIPYLVSAFGLLEIYNFVKRPEGFLDEAQDWLNSRGTKKSLKIALKWLEFSQAEVFESPSRIHWFCYSICLDRSPTKEEIAVLTKVADLSTPLRSKLTRIFTKEKDIRKLTLSSKHAHLSRNILSNDSGVLTNGILVSV